VRVPSWPNFRRLQWKLTLTYTLVTTGAILVVELVLLVTAGVLIFRSTTFPKVLVPIFSDATRGLAPALKQHPPDEATLDAWLKDLARTGRLDTSNGKQNSTMSLNLDPAMITLAAISDRQGHVISAYPTTGCARGTLLQRCVREKVATLLHAALAGDEDPDHLVAHRGQVMFISVPILDHGEPVGALFIRMSLPQGLQEYQAVAVRSLFSSTLVIALFAAIIGTLFGFLTARGLTRRLNALAGAADAWSRGDFSLVIQERSQDELGHLARRLNRMAEQLQNLLQAREELAALEERNRLARDLHDSVKQQVFAVVMQIAAARHLLDRDPDAARTRLIDAERLARQAQRELTDLIRELRPAALQGKGLVAALQDFVAEWSRRTDIDARLRLQGARPLPLDVEQALFRVVQEAMANVARHSNARQVEVRLAWKDGTVLLRIADDGRGFNPDTARGRGVGLKSMEERVRALGGTFYVTSDPGKGTVVEVRLKQG